MKTLLASVLLLLGVIAPADAQSSLLLRFEKPIERGRDKEDEILAFTLDSDIYAATRDGLPDLRVFDSARTEVPFLIETVFEHREERQPQSFRVQIVSAKPDGQKLEVRIRLSDNSPNAEAIHIATPLSNYERKVQVAGSVDGMHWTPLIESAIIFDYSKFMDVSNPSIPLPKNTCREFKLTINDVTDERESPFQELTKTIREGGEKERIERTVIERRPFRIDRISAVAVAVRDRVEQPKLTEYPIDGFEAKNDAENKRTIVAVRTNRQPLTEVTLQVTNRNFSRPVIVQVPAARGDKTEWNNIAKSTVSNVSFRDLNQKELSVSFAPHRDATVRILIANDDNPPLVVTGVEARGIVQRVVFIAEAGKDYRVAYGSTSVEAPKYEANAILTKLTQANIPVAAKLGPQIENPGVPIQTTSRRLLDNWYFLGAAIAIMVAVLGWSLLRAGSRLNDLPKD